MVSLLSWLVRPQDFFPPTPDAYAVFYNAFKYFGLAGLVTTVAPHIQAMGRTSAKDSRFNLPGRSAWFLIESVGPIYLTYIVYTLPAKLHPPPADPSSFLGTGLPAWNEVLYLLYMLHYLNRAIISPLVMNPSMSPIHAVVACGMGLWQALNSGNIGSWLVYSTAVSSPRTPSSPSNALFSLPFKLIGLALFTTGLYVNIRSENYLYSLRRSAAKRRARSEGKPFVTYDKVYVIPPTTATEPKSPPWFQYFLFPHYLFEWIEWMGYWIIGLGCNLPASLPPSSTSSSSSPSTWSAFFAPGFRFRNTYGAGFLASKWWMTPAFWFFLNEVLVMVPRARQGRQWYEDKFGKRAVAGRGSVTPFGW